MRKERPPRRLSAPPFYQGAGRVMGLAILMTSCASRPSFTPSQKVESVGSGNEALLLCAEYRLPVPSPRAIVMKTWVDCVQSVDDDFGSRMGPELSVLQRELGQAYAQIRDPEWKPSWAPELNLAVPALLRALALQSPTADPVRFTVAEQTAAIRFFPDTARALHAAQWKTMPEVQNDPRLLRLQAAVVAWSRELHAAGARTVEAGQPLPALCPQLTDLEIKARDLGRVAQDLRDLRKLGELGDLGDVAEDPSAYAGQPAYANYQTRLETLRAQVGRFRTDLAQTSQAALQCPLPRKPNPSARTARPGKGQ